MEVIDSNFIIITVFNPFVNACINSYYKLYGFANPGF